MAYVYADTFSHYGFSGVASKESEIREDNLEILNKSDLPEDVLVHIEASGKSFREKYGHEAKGWKSVIADVKSAAAEALTGGLGHATVLTYPDRPYLVWAFKYEKQDEGGRRGRRLRDNPATFHEGGPARCTRYSTGRSPSRREQGNTAALEGRQRGCAPGDRDPREVRSTGRGMATPDGDRTAGRQHHKQIPVYDGDRWNEAREKMVGTSSEEALDKPVYQVAALHRVYVLRDLLPEHGIVGD